MTKIIIHTPLKNAKRIKVTIPYKYKEIRTKFKSLNSTFWHPKQKLWSILNTKENMDLMKHIFGDNHEVRASNRKVELPKIQLNEQSNDVLFELQKRLVLKHYSGHSIKIYRRMLILFWVDSRIKT